MELEQLGRYEVLGELGRGAMGIVYKSWDPVIDRIVAIKTIDLGLSPAESRAFEQRFDREAKTTGRLNHPNIVTIYDMGRSGDVAYIAMELLEGRTLRAILESGVVLPPAMIERIAAQIADGLAFAHKHGVVHCDVKPANIVVLESGLVKITDFGIAMLPTGSRTFAGNLFGSPRYISPEQAMGRTVDARSDIFSLGVVLYEMLTGLPPFMATALPEILHQVIHEKAVAPSRRNPGIPSAFDYIVARAMAKQPEHRYQSALDMAFDLRKLALEEPGFAPVPAVALKEEPITRPRPGDDTVLLEGAGTLARSGEPSGPPEETSASASMRQRRRMVVYGVPAALFAMGGWILLSRYASNREEGTVTIHSPDRDAAHSVPAKIAPLASADSIATPPVAAETNAVQPLPSAPRATGREAPRAKKGNSAATKRMARLAFAVTPWGEVYVDGRKKGVAPPLNEITVAPGKHTIEIRNTTFRPHRLTVELRADASVRIKHKFA